MNSVREIAREWDLVEREFRVGLSKTAYGSVEDTGVLRARRNSGRFFSGCVCADFLPHFHLDVSNGVLLCTACAAGSLLGLCVSALSRNVNMCHQFFADRIHSADIPFRHTHAL